MMVPFFLAVNDGRGTRRGPYLYTYMIKEYFLGERDAEHLTSFIVGDDDDAADDITCGYLYKCTVLYVQRSYSLNCQHCACSHTF